VKCHILCFAFVVFAAGCSGPDSFQNNNKTVTPTPSVFRLSIDKTLWKKWSFKYPVTYVFNLSQAPRNAKVMWRSSINDSWAPLCVKKESDFFNGVDAVRFDKTNKKAYVSVGYKTSHIIYLAFKNIATVTYDFTAKYYDNRKAAYTLSMDNWGMNNKRDLPRSAGSSYPGVQCSAMTDDNGDKYQAATWAARLYQLPISVAINSIGRDQSNSPCADNIWPLINAELKKGGLEPAVHTRHHPYRLSDYLKYDGYAGEIIGCRDDLLARLTNIPYGQHVYEFILPTGLDNEELETTCSGEFLFLRDWKNSDSPAGTTYVTWNTEYHYYGIGGFQTKTYDRVFEGLDPNGHKKDMQHKGRYYQTEVEALNAAVDKVFAAGGVFYAMWHPDRYLNSVIYDNADPPEEGKSGSSLVQHFKHISQRKDIWYAANGWLYLYHLNAAKTEVKGL